MNKRLQQFLAAENISQSQFADTIGAARASISHILAGRNKPGFDFLERMARHYPELNLEWLITGRGRMYNSTKSAPEGPVGPVTTPAEPVSESLFDAPQNRQESAPFNPFALPSPSSDTSDNKVELHNNQKSISKVIVFYSDGTFQELV